MSKYQSNKDDNEYYVSTYANPYVNILLFLLYAIIPLATIIHIVLLFKEGQKLRPICWIIYSICYFSFIILLATGVMH